MTKTGLNSRFVIFLALGFVYNILFFSTCFSGVFLLNKLKYRVISYILSLLHIKH